MSLFQLLHGSHSEIVKSGKTRKVVTYDIPKNSEESVFIESDRDLVKDFGRDRFRRVSQSQVRATVPTSTFNDPQRPTKPHLPPEEEFDAEPEVKISGSVGLGTEVTDQFPEAEQRELRVWKRDKKMYVTTEKDTSKPIHDDPLTTSKQVQKIIDQWSAEHHTPNTEE